jgi:hypothetical protein
MISAEHCASVYGLGDRFSQNQVSVETRLWWKAGWQFHWHRIVAYQKSKLRLGTYSLPLYDTGAEEVQIDEKFSYARDSQNAVAAQTLLGFSQIRRQDSNPDVRTHILSWHSLLLLAETDWLEGEHDLVALTWVGKPDEAAETWSVGSSRKGSLSLSHPKLGSWRIEHPDLPVCPTATMVRPGLQPISR